MESIQAIGERHGTSKLGAHSYGRVYDQLFMPLRKKPIQFLEIGMDQGCSLRTWLDAFPRATIHGMDTGPIHGKNAGFTDPRLVCHVQDYKDPAVANLFPPLSLDVIMDDADHVPEHQRAAFHYLWPALKVGGLYIVEDMPLQHHTAEILRPWTLIDGCSIYAGFCGPQGFRWQFSPDDVLVIIRKQSA